MDKLNEQSIEEEKWYQGPLKYIIGIFLVFLITLMTIPYYGLKLNPEPNYNFVELDFYDDNYTKFESILDVQNLEVSQTIRNNAVKISSERCQSSIICNAKALFYFVRDEIDYIPDPSREYVQHPIETLKSRGGDCEDKSILLANLLSAVGFNTRFALTFNHAYVQVWIPDAMDKYKSEDSWISLDSACEYCDFGEIPPKYVKMSKNYIHFN